MMSPPSAVTHAVSRAGARVMEDIRRVATAKGRAGVGAFLVEGRRMLERALRAGWVPREVLVGRALAESAEIVARVEALGGRCHLEPDAALLELSQGRRSGLFSALFELPSAAPASELLVAGSTPAVFLVLVDVDEPGNVGALLRTALASGAAGLICVGSSDPFHPKAVRTSLGSLFKLPFTRVPSSEGLLPLLRARAIYSLAAVARDGQSIDRAIWPHESVAIFVGNEGQGLSEAVRFGADARVSIDLSAAADSFCVNAAAAVCLYEVQRRLRFSALTSPGHLTRQGA